MRLAYVLAPFAGWCVSGGVKFLYNSVRARRLAWREIGTYGSFPSTHTAIVSATAFLIGFAHGFNTPAFSVACALAVVVIMDATGLRRHLGSHAAAINVLMRGDRQWRVLRERMGHRLVEVAAGLAVGLGCGWVLHRLGV